MYNPIKEILPVGFEFSIAVSSFVARDGTEHEGCTISDPLKHEEMGLPRWVKSPLIYKIDESGKVWGRHASQDRYRLKHNSVEEFKEVWKEAERQSLAELGYSLEDVKD